MGMAARWRLPLLLALLTGGVCAWAWPAGAGPWRALGLLSGWAGLVLCTCSLLLLLRHPALASALGGLEAMLRAHHLSGTVGYLALLVHPLALAVDDGALLDPRGAGPGLWLGWLALLLLMLGLFTSFVPRLPWRRWQAWHQVLAVAVVLALAHAALVTNRPVVLGWLAAAMVVALAGRYGLVDRGALAMPFRVRAVQHRADDVVEATLAPAAAGLQAQPGQFVLLSLGRGPGFDGCGEFHPFTVTGGDADGSLRVAIKALGTCSARAQHVTPGTAVRVQGPFGDFLAGRTERPQLWVAGGIGITPFVAALRAAPLRQPTALLHLWTPLAEPPFADELQQMAASQPLLQWLPAASRDAVRDLPALLDAVADLPARQVFACGPAPLVQALRKALAAHGIPAEAVHAERFDWR